MFDFLKKNKLAKLSEDISSLYTIASLIKNQNDNIFKLSQSLLKIKKIIDENTAKKVKLEEADLSRCFQVIFYFLHSSETFYTEIGASEIMKNILFAIEENKSKLYKLIIKDNKNNEKNLKQYYLKIKIESSCFNGIMIDKYVSQKDITLKNNIEIFFIDFFEKGNGLIDEITLSKELLSEYEIKLMELEKYKDNINPKYYSFINHILGKSRPDNNFEYINYFLMSSPFFCSIVKNKRALGIENCKTDIERELFLKTETIEEYLRYTIIYFLTENHILRILNKKNKQLVLSKEFDIFYMDFTLNNEKFI